MTRLSLCALRALRWFEMRNDSDEWGSEASDQPTVKPVPVRFWWLKRVLVAPGAKRIDRGEKDPQRKEQDATRRKPPRPTPEIPTLNEICASIQRPTISHSIPPPVETNQPPAGYDQHARAKSNAETLSLNAVLTETHPVWSYKKCTPEGESNRVVHAWQSVSRRTSGTPALRRYPLYSSTLGSLTLRRR